MAKVFRLYNGNNNIQDWGNSVAYGSKAISEIEDPNAADAKKEITSIPSPFARIDLVKNAYHEVVKSGQLHGKTIFHKTVSDSLDIAQIFFYLPNLSDKVKIIQWDAEREIESLTSSGSKEQQRVGNTLKMYLKQDAQTYNFDKLSSIYLLHYVGEHRKTQLDIIGATSPSTLFFSSANDLEYLSNDIRFGNDKVFDEEYTSLDQRSKDFIVYYYAFRKAHNNFARIYPEVNEYMDMVYKELGWDLKNKIDALTDCSINDYKELSIGNNLVEINGASYRVYSNSGNIESGFEIVSNISCETRKPLVLPVETGNKYCDIHYISAKWAKDHKAPYYDKRPIDQRTLPFANEKHPYLTISDFLEDTLIRVENKENSDTEAFFNKHEKDLSNDKNNSYQYLLPLKDTFFKYFTIQNLKEKVSGKSMIEMKSRGDDYIEVTLRIPIRDGKTIEFVRSYIKGHDIDLDNNKGCIIEREFAVGLFSNIAFANVSNAYYRGCIMSDFEEQGDYNLRFMANEGKQLSTDIPIIRNKNTDSYYQFKTYIVEKQTFDYIRIDCKEHSGVLIPLMHNGNGSDCFTFAIDFGTTNTHIEYNINNGASTPFEISGKEEKMLKLWGYVDDIAQKTFEINLMPNIISNNSLFKYPMRTALCMSTDTNWNKPTFALANTNIPYTYEKYREHSYNKIITDIKWSNEKDNRQQVKNYVDNLFLILRTKVLHNNGNLEKTKIVWFYPISMVSNRYNEFAKIWVDAYCKYFGGDKHNVIPMTESVAPYEHYRSSDASVNNIVTIDIGGGTTDIVLANDSEVKGITSFRFAANSIFGDPYMSSRSSASINKLLVEYENDITSVLKDNNLTELQSIFERHIKNKVSSNIASFLFSLKENEDIRKGNISDKVDFNDLLLHNSRYKIVFVFFYVAIIYHLAHMMKARKHEMPRHISFSGNGSKIIRILTSDNNTLEKLTIAIFEKVYEGKYPLDGLTILQNEENPKEVTCKGGLAKPEKQEYDDIMSKKIIFKNVDKTSPFICNETYKDVDDEYIDSVVEECKKFVNFVLGLNNTFSFKTHFGTEASTIEIAKSVCFRDLKTFVKNGLEEKRKEVSENDSIEETMFFYPLSGMLNALIAAIYNAQNNKR